jgi:hypothetical protein
MLGRVFDLRQTSVGASNDSEGNEGGWGPAKSETGIPTDARLSNAGQFLRET